MRLVFSLIGYVSTATVLALVMGCAYLWHTRMVTNEKLFRMAALLHDIDLEAIEQEEDPSEREVPPEETSLEEKRDLRQIKLRNYEVKMNSLKLGKQEFEHSARQLNAARARFDEMASELERRLEQQGELSTKENLVAVVNQLQAVKPQQAKDLLFMFLEEPGGEKDVILLLKSMQDNKRQRILQQFRTPPELEKLHEIEKLMLEGYPDKPMIDNMLERIRTPETES